MLIRVWCWLGALRDGLVVVARYLWAWWVCGFQVNLVFACLVAVLVGLV